MGVNEPYFGAQSTLILKIRNNVQLLRTPLLAVFKIAFSFQKKLCAVRSFVDAFRSANKNLSCGDLLV